MSKKRVTHEELLAEIKSLREEVDRLRAVPVPQPLPPVDFYPRRRRYWDGWPPGVAWIVVGTDTAGQPLY